MFFCVCVHIGYTPMAQSCCPFVRMVQVGEMFELYMCMQFMTSKIIILQYWQS